MKKMLFVIYIFSIILQAYTLKEAQEMCKKQQGEEAIKIYSLLSEKGDDNATEKLINIFGWGKCGINHNYEKQNYYLKKLAKKGNIKAADSLANNYMIGTGTSKNLKKAEYWLTKYRDTSKAKNQYDIATKFSILGMHDKALKWYLLSAKQNYIKSFYWLGKIYRYGSGSTLKNPKTALFWWEKGAKLGDYACMEKTSDLYYYFNNEKNMYIGLKKLQIINLVLEPSIILDCIILMIKVNIKIRKKQHIGLQKLINMVQMMQKYFGININCGNISKR